MREDRLRQLLALSTALMLGGLGWLYSVTAVRAEPGAVTGVWQGVISLTVFPCPGGGSCDGSFSGSLAGTAAGLDSNGHPFVVTWPDPTGIVMPTNLSATFLYSEQCPIGATGTASGSFTLTGGLVDDNGTVTHDGTMTGEFGWLRLGLVVVVQTTGGVLTGDGQTLSTEQTIGVGSGAFAPTSIPSTCANVETISAHVVGGYGSE